MFGGVSLTKFLHILVKLGICSPAQPQDAASVFDQMCCQACVNALIITCDVAWHSILCTRRQRQIFNPRLVCATDVTAAVRTAVVFHPAT